ncbi:hypothetical protein TorRG33x02_131630 [Trema orientale]|uniref:Uncharacterized protein n=1 Tax=Trema orientale TaxID=63057 RepID=A0A2P5F013_TREOI|nr:hypothetical protein TorRG33x02_131630 [Trema orientale]
MLCFPPPPRLPFLQPPHLPPRGPVSNRARPVRKLPGDPNSGTVESSPTPPSSATMFSELELLLTPFLLCSRDFEYAKLKSSSTTKWVLPMKLRLTGTKSQSSRSWPNRRRFRSGHRDRGSSPPGPPARGSSTKMVPLLDGETLEPVRNDEPHSKKINGGDDAAVVPAPAPLRRQKPIRFSHSEILPLHQFLIWVFEPHLRSHMANQSLASFLHSETKRFDVHANVAISDGVRNESTQSWTSSGKSVNEMERPSSMVRLGSSSLAIFSSLICKLGTIFSGKLFLEKGNDSFNLDTVEEEYVFRITSEDSWKL